MDRYRSILAFAWWLPVILMTGCSITRPCADGGDVSWTPKIVGDKRCTQKDFPGGRTLNHGKFTQAYQSTGKIALEGEFDEGKRQGIWLYYAEDQKLKAVKYYDRGIEKTPPADAQKEIDRLIQQKAGQR
jgi:hypothetical protein